MTQLIHGGDIYTALEKGKTLLDFSANINPLGVPRGVRDALAGAIEQCSNYPDPLCRRLKKDLAQKIKVAEDYLIFGNGAADLIFRLVTAVKPKKAMVLAPTFAEYEQALAIADCQVEHYYLKDSFQLEHDFLDHLDETLDLLFLCNPNNPTGQLINQELLVAIAEACQQKKILLVLDECFLDFLEDPDGHTLQGHLKEYLFILRAFTKNYALPGVRLGYGLCSNKPLLEKMQQQSQPWSVSLLAQEAGIQALKEDEYLQEARELIFRERDWLVSQLAELGYKVYPPAANYIFFHVQSQPESFQEDLEKEGILVRCCANYRGLEKGYFRIAVRTHQENVTLINGMKRRG